MKTLIPSFLLACLVVFGSLYGLYRYSLMERQVTPPQTARTVPSPQVPASAPTDHCPGGKMLLGECHVRKPDQPELWIRQSDSNRPKSLPSNTVNVASSGITDNERRRVAEFEAKVRTEAAEREAIAAQLVAQQSSDRAMCESIDKEIASIDAATRQPLTAQWQDWYRARRKDLKDRLAGLRC